MRLHFKLLLTLLGLFSVTTVAQAGELPFTDADNSAHFEAIYKMKEWGIFDGYSDGSFGYIKEINRAELSKVLVLGSGVEESEVSSCADGASKSFSDVAAGEWYADYVYCAEANGWVSGDDGADTFRPGDPVLLPEAFKMILESQYGTPDESFEGEMWYDLYVNPLVDSNIIYQDSDWGSYYYYTFLPGYSTMGFDSIITSKTTRQDIAELLYRVRTVLEEGDGELGEYNQLLTLDEYEEKYGASVEESSDGVLTIGDPHFGFEMTNVYIADFDPDDLQIWIKNESAFENGSFTTWNLMYPTLDIWSEIDLDEVFSLKIYDPDSDPDDELTAYCYLNAPFDLWDIQNTLCGTNNENADSFESLLQLTAYGENYSGEVISLSPAIEQAQSILNFSEIIWRGASQAYWYEYGEGAHLDYLETLLDLQGEDSEQEAELLAWLEEFIASFSSGNEDETVEAYEALEPIISKYELKLLDSFGETLVLNVELTQATSYNQVDYIIYDTNADTVEILEGNVDDAFWDSFSLNFAQENDPLGGQYFGRDQSITEWVTITVQNEPILSEDFNVSNDELTHVFTYTNGSFHNAYYFEITEAQAL